MQVMKCGKFKLLNGTKLISQQIFLVHFKIPVYIVLKTFFCN